MKSLSFAIIDRYMLREFAVHLLAISGVLWLIYVATRFARYLAQAAVGNIPADVIFSLLWLNSLGALSVLFPIATFLAVMLSLGRMHSDNELTVMAACGVHDNRIVRNVAVFAGVMAIIVAYLALQVVPDMRSDRYALEEKAEVTANTTGLVAGSFKESQGGDWTFYSESISDDKQTMQSVFIEIERDDRPITLRSKSGHFEIDPDTGDKYLILEDGYRYEGAAGDRDFAIADFTTHSILVERGGEVQVRQKQKSMPTTALWQRGTSEDLAELQWRIATAVMTMILSLIAVPLTRAGPRQGRYVGFLPAVIIYIVYSNLLGVTRAWIEKDQIAPLTGALWVHLLMIGVMIVLFKRATLSRLIKRRRMAQT